MKNLKNFIIAAAILGFSHTESRAQNQPNSGNATATASQPVQLGLSDAIEVTFPNGNPTQVASISTIADLLNGVELPDTDVRVRSNKAFKVEVASSANSFSYMGNALIAPILSATNAIRVKVVSNQTGGQPVSGGWVFLNSIGTAPLTLINNCNPGGNQDFTLKYKMIPGLTLPAGTYTIDMVLTATQL